MPRKKGGSAEKQDLGSQVRLLQAFVANSGMEWYRKNWNRVEWYGRGIMEQNGGGGGETV